MSASPATASVSKNGSTSYTVAPASDNTVVISGYTITNSLPVTQFKADKLWDDNKNQDGKRPAALDFKLSRKIETESDSDKKTASSESDASSAHVSGKDTDTKWAVDFGVQPEYDVQNRQYQYSAAEGIIEGYTCAVLEATENSVNAYDTSYFPEINADNRESEDSTISLGITNTLITKPITLVKKWNDHGCTQTDLHYPVTYQVSQPDGNKVHFDSLSVKLDPADKTTSTWEVQTGNVPVYDIDGKPLLYIVTETSDQHYG